MIQEDRISKMLSKLLPVICLLCVVFGKNVVGYTIMQSDNPSVESVKTQYEDQLIAIDGVETISVGLGKDGMKCLMIGLSVPIEAVRDKLPIDIFTVPVEFVHIGNIDAQ